MPTATDRAYTRLRAWILEGRYEVGSPLGEIKLAELLGVSRTPIREALHRLSSERLVEISPNRGARVASWSARDLAEIYELRALLESHAAARAALQIDRSGLQRLEELCQMEERAIRSASIDSILSLNRDFHAGVAEFSGNQRLAEVIVSLVDLPSVLMSFIGDSGSGETRFDHNLADHRTLVEALGRRDAGLAEAVMRSHMLRERAELLAEKQSNDVETPVERHFG